MNSLHEIDGIKYIRSQIGVIKYICPLCGKKSESGFHLGDSGCLHVLCSCKGHFIVKIKNFRECKECDARVDCLGRQIVYGKLSEGRKRATSR